MTHALILTAGLGTRLRPLTHLRAKAAMPVGGEPLVRRIITWAASHGVTDIVLNLHHRPETLTAVVGDGRDLGVRVRYSWEPTILGSAGGTRLALPILDADRFFVINGDTLTDLDLTRMADAHRASGALVSLALVPNRDFTRYGGVMVDERSDTVTGFVHRGPEARGSWHFIGVQAVEASAIAPLPVNVPLASIGGVYDDLLRHRPGAIHAFRGDWAFWDVGTATDYLTTSCAFSTGVDVACGRRDRIAPSARLSRTIVWDDVEIGAGATLEECIVTDGVQVPPGASYRQAILIAAPGGIAVTPVGVSAAG